MKQVNEYIGLKRKAWNTGPWSRGIVWLGHSWGVLHLETVIWGPLARMGRRNVRSCSSVSVCKKEREHERKPTFTTRSSLRYTGSAILMIACKVVWVWTNIEFHERERVPNRNVSERKGNDQIGEYAHPWPPGYRLQKEKVSARQVTVYRSLTTKPGRRQKLYLANFHDDEYKLRSTSSTWKSFKRASSFMHCTHLNIFKWICHVT